MARQGRRCNYTLCNRLHRVLSSAALCPSVAFSNISLTLSRVPWDTPAISARSSRVSIGSDFNISCSIIGFAKFGKGLFKPNFIFSFPLFLKTSSSSSASRHLSHFVILRLPNWCLLGSLVYPMILFTESKKS